MSLNMLVVDIKPWSLIPIMIIVFGFIATFFAIFAGRKLVKSDKIFNIIILIFGAMFIGMELVHEIGRYQEYGTYDWSSFPFQLCSVSMYLTILVPCIKKEKVKKTFIMFFALFTLLSGILPLFFGQGNLTRWPNMKGILFSFFWHVLLMIVGGFAIGYANVGECFKKEYKTILYTFLIFFGITCVAQILNLTIHTFAGAWDKPLDGFKEIGYIPNYELDPDSCSLFYISPFFKSNIPVVFGDIWTNFGWIACWAVYVVAFCFGAFLIYSIIFGVRKSYSLIYNMFNKDKIKEEI